MGIESVGTAGLAQGTRVAGPERTAGAPPPPLGWSSSRRCAALLVAAYVVVALLPATLAFTLLPPAATSVATRVGLGAALVGFTLLALQVVLSARLRPVDRPFGLDRVMRFHKRMALVALVLLAAHPILLMVGFGGASLLNFDTSWRVWLGKGALLALLAVVFVAWSFKELGLDYQVWRFLHKGAIAVVVLGFLHGWVIGPDLRPVGMRACWAALGLLALGLFVYRNAYVPLWGRRRFRVADVRPQTHDTFTLSLASEDGRPLPHQPGQFMFLKLVRPGRPSEEHPFTIASSPTTEGPLQATIKQSGDFTNTIGQTLIEAPYGRFSYVYSPGARSLLFIAGGVGITPIMSMLRALRDTGDRRPVTLVFGNKAERDIVFREELEALPKHVRIVHVLSAVEEGWRGLRGYVTGQLLQAQVGPMLSEAEIYLCGPPPMMASVARALLVLGVPRRRIHTERFAL